MEKDIYKLLENIMEDINLENTLKSHLSTLPEGYYYLLALGKAGFEMGRIASKYLKDRLVTGLIITKYGHAKCELENIEIIETGHPIPDGNSLMAGKLAIEFLKFIPKDGKLLFLLSGGGSALMEYPMDGIDLLGIQEITEKLLASGASITEINTIRKHLSKVKGGRLSEYFKGEKIYSLIVSDVLEDRIDSIASGPMTVDYSTSQEALNILEKYDIQVSVRVKSILEEETVKEIKNLEEKIILNIDSLCSAALTELEKLGYNSYLITNNLNCEAEEGGKFIASIGKSIIEDKTKFKRPAALVFGGETVVNLKGNGKGGRNTELALSAMIELKDTEGISVLAFASDGTDGPTDSSGGFINGTSYKKAIKENINPEVELLNNNSYFVLEKIGDLLKTGPTGNNLNDLYILFVD